MTLTKFQVKGHVNVKCQSHKVITLQDHRVYRYLTVHGLDLYPGHLTLRWSWPWPLNDLDEIAGQRSEVISRSKVTSRSNVKVTRSSYYKVTRSSYYSTDILLSKIETGACIPDFSSWSFILYIFIHAKCKTFKTNLLSFSTCLNGMTKIYARGNIISEVITTTFWPIFE